MNSPRPSVDTLHDLDLSAAWWRKSSHSGGANDCVEVAELGAYVAVRDSKRGELRPLVLRRGSVRALVAGLVAGEV